MSHINGFHEALELTITLCEASETLEEAIKKLNYCLNLVKENKF